jgi:general secretion pathway protein C
MKILNKLLTLLLFCICINLVREYIFASPKSVESFSVPVPEGVDFNMPKKDWSYYATVFQNGTIPVYNEEKSVQTNVSVDLILKGIILSSPTRSFAIIENMVTKQQDLYRLGDVVNGAKIVSMTREKVGLDYNGIKCELGLYEKKSDSVKTTMVQDKTETETEEKPINNGIKDILKDKAMPDSLKSIKDLDFSKLLTQLRIKPYFESGKCIGFQLDNINSGFIKQMGLRDGDVIQSINGVKIDDPLKALQILYGIQNNNPIHLGVGRGDEKIEMDCKIEG